MYKTAGHRHQVTIDGKTFWVDSNQEETLIRWLEENGFHDKWRHLDYGIKSGKDNYTPDLELSVFFNGMIHRALVESKPSLSFFNNYISRRMRGSAKYYYTELLLLYVHDTKAWYRVDKKTGEINEFGIPVPAERPIARLYTPFSKKAPNKYYHQYRERLALGRTITLKVADGIESGLQALLFPKNTKRRSYRRRR